MVFFLFTCIPLFFLAYTGDDCKGKQYTETHTVLLKKSTRRQRLVEALWSILAYTG